MNKLKAVDKNTVIFLIVLLIIYFGMNLYYNYQSEMMTQVPEASAEELSACSISELPDDRISLTIPSTYVYGASQSDLDNACKAAGYESITLNSDGSATYIITQQQHEAMMKDLHQGISDKLASLPGSEHFKEISEIEYNDDFTSYTVHLSTSGAGFDSSMSALNLKMFTTMYNCFQGVTDESIYIDYVNKSGSTVATLDSKIK